MSTKIAIIHRSDGRWNCENSILVR